MLIIIIVIAGLLTQFFNRNWKLIYSAYGYEDYFRVISKLSHGGVKYKTKTHPDISHQYRHKDNTQYDIFVKKDKEHLAIQALQR